MAEKLTVEIPCDPEMADALRRVAALKAERDLFANALEHLHSFKHAHPATWAQIRQAMGEHFVENCEDPECPGCSVIICPFGDPHHFHRGGCPHCSGKGGGLGHGIIPPEKP